PGSAQPRAYRRPDTYPASDLREFGVDALLYEYGLAQSPVRKRIRAEAHGVGLGWRRQFHVLRLGLLRGSERRDSLRERQQQTLSAQAELRLRFLPARPPGNTPGRGESGPVGPRRPDPRLLVQLSVGDRGRDLRDAQSSHLH